MNFGLFIIVMRYYVSTPYIMSKKCLQSSLDNILSIGFLCENWMVRFGKPDGPVFSKNS
jgi:hypothetical protein